MRPVPNHRTKNPVLRWHRTVAALRAELDLVIPNQPWPDDRTRTMAKRMAEMHERADHIARMN